MTNLNEALYRAMLKYVQAKGTGAVEVTGFDTDSYEAGYCDTCSYTQYTVDINYKTADGHWGSYRYEGTFASLIGDLETYDVD